MQLFHPLLIVFSITKKNKQIVYMIDINPSTGFPNMYNFINNRLLTNLNGNAKNTQVQGGSFVALIVFTFVIIGYYIIFSYLGVGGNPDTTIPSNGIKFIEIIMWGMFIFLILVNGLQYFLNIDLKAGIKNIFNPQPELNFNITNKNKKRSNRNPDESGEYDNNENSNMGDDNNDKDYDDNNDKDYDGDDDDDDDNNSKTKKRQRDLYNLNDSDNYNDDESYYGLNNNGIDGREEVFHVNDNKYNYDDAKAVCKAHGAKLANYKQIEDAYENGAEWCGFGWSDNQMALYPTQKKTWDKLQKIEGHENDCGRPGVNGGFIDNKNILFGANCYGYKKASNEDEKLYMENVSPIPLTKKDEDFQKRVDHYKNNLNLINRAPFNYDSWNE